MPIAYLTFRKGVAIKPFAKMAKGAKDFWNKNLPFD
jgi:hypothetical protein